MKKIKVSMEFERGKGRIVSGDFNTAVSQLRRPYIPISEEDYDRITRELIKKPSTDYLVDSNGVKYTFGGADGGFALMPVVKDKKGNLV